MDDARTALLEVEKPRAMPSAPARRPEGLRLVRALFLNRAALVGLTIILGVVVCALFAPVLSPRDPIVQDIARRVRPPDWIAPEAKGGVLGTDHLGRDILSRLIYGARISLIIGLSAVLISGTLGTAIGLVAGYHGGKIDDLLMRIVDMMLAMPFILLAIAVVAVLGPSLKNIILVLGVTAWTSYARVVRAEVLALREREFVSAALALGSGARRIIFRHLLPNVVTPVIVIATLEVARMIILESALSFLGLGVQPPTPTWGGMLADGRVYLATAWWLATFPGLAIMLTVLGINLVGDWLRDTLDPRLQQI